MSARFKKKLRRHLGIPSPTKRKRDMARENAFVDRHNTREGMREIEAMAYVEDMSRASKPKFDGDDLFGD